jgi:lysophospholipid acyltransferase (LPLAT)-like uncharacterized protein
MSDYTPLWMRWAGLISATGIRAWMSTLDYRALYFDPSVDVIHPASRPRIYVFWHEYILLPLHMRGNCNLTMLLSKHRDADILYRLAYHMGFQCVRGSTYGGGAEALLELSRRGQHMHMAITPDGPRGPRRRLAQGAIFLASRLQLPIVPFGMGLDRPWRTPTWDQFAVPRPGSRARAVVGPEIVIPPGLDRAELELRRRGVERLLNELTSEAEAWAHSGEQRLGALPIVRQGLSLDDDAMSTPTPPAAGLRDASPTIIARPVPLQRVAGY